MRVIKERECGIVRRVHLLDDDGEPIVAVGRFLDHLAERACSPHTLSAYGYDLQQLFTFLAGEQLVWEAFGRPMPCGSWRSCDGGQVSAQRSGSDSR